MRHLPLSSLSLGLVLTCLLAVGLSAQITLPNASPLGGPATVTTVGSLHSIDTADMVVGTGSCARAGGSANSSFMPTSWAINPSANGDPTGVSGPGFSIEWWYKPVNPLGFHYILGDAAWVGANGAFRVFANGAAGVGNVIVRGPLAQVRTLNSALTTQVGPGNTVGPIDPNTGAIRPNPAGWIHLALVYNQIQDRFLWYVNGVLNNATPNGSTSGLTGQGVNLTHMGYNGSSASGPQGNFDDIRFYDFARVGADILADVDFSLQTLQANTCFPAGQGGCSVLTGPGVGPTGAVNLPPQGLYECDGATNPQICSIRVGNSDPLTTEVRLMTGGSSLQWAGSTPQTPAANPPASAFLNLDGVIVGGTPLANPRQLAFRDPPPLAQTFSTPGVVGLELGNFLSSPPLSTGITVLDGLLIGPFLGPITLPIPYAMNSGPGFPISVPAGIFQPGDRIDLQFISLDPTAPGNIAVTNRCTFIHVDPIAGPHFHAEARGVAVIQVTGYWEIWNTGSVPISQVVIDLSTATVGDMWNPTGALNSGGTLAGGNSLRFMTDQFTGYTGFTGLNPQGTFFGALQLNFTSFSATTDHFIFDGDTSNGGPGNTMIGATVTVTFADPAGTVLAGTFVADPTDSTAAVLDL